MDAQGFQLLHQLRGYFPQTRSLMMDTATCEAFLAFAGSVVAPAAIALSRLTADEQAVYQRLIDAPHANRLEQEHIRHTYVLRVLGEMGGRF